MRHRFLSRRGEILDGLFKDYRGANFAIRFQDGVEWTQRPGSSPALTLVIVSPAALDSLLLRAHEISLGEAFVQRDFDIEGDIFAAFEMAKHLFSRRRSFRQALLAWALVGRMR